MHKKVLYTVFMLVAMLAIVVTPAGAVTDGELDGNDHPYVGLMVAFIDGQPQWRCSGTLLSPTIYLTAGHCTYGADHVEIWFGSDLTNAAAVNYPYEGDVSGTPYTHPDYNDNAFYLHDLGVVVLDEPVVMPEYGELPTLNLLSELAAVPGKPLRFTSVGYGLQKSFPDAAAWKNSALRIRMVAHPRLVQIDRGVVGDFSVLLSNNANTGGTCFGDSGGPNFIGDSNVIGGVTSYGRNSTCAGSGGVYRIDTADDLNWLYSEFGDQL